MYGKLMSLPDTLIVPYFEYLTDTPEEELAEMLLVLRASAGPTAVLPSLRTDEGVRLYPPDSKASINPIELKKRLAWEITATFYDRQTANAAQENFERVVQRRDLPEDIPGYPLVKAEGQRWSTILVDTDLATSTSEAKRLINQGAVYIITPSGESSRLSGDSQAIQLEPGTTIRAGRRKYISLVG
jgi:tyrosyl-tRNA synthetase